MKIRIRPVVASVVGALVLSACSSASTATGEAGGKVTMWMYPVIRDEVVSEKFWNQVETDFEAAHEDVDLAIELQTFDKRDEQISAALAAGTGPDLVMITPDQVSSFLAVDGLLPVDEAIADSRDAFFEPGLDVSTFDGKLYGVPLFQNAQTAAYNKKVFADAGLEWPTTWEEVLAAAPILAKRGIAVLDYAGSPGPSLNVTFYPFLWQAGGRVFTDDGSDVAFDSPEGEAALNFLVELEKRGGLPVDAASRGTGIEGSPFAAGKVGLRATTTLGELREMRAALGEDTVALGLPLEGKVRATFAAPGMLSLTAINDEDNRAAAMTAIEYLTSPAVQEPLNEASATFPTRSDAAAPDLGPDGETMSEALKYAIPGETHPNARQIMSILAPQIQAALRGDATPKEALDRAAAEARELLERS